MTIGNRHSLINVTPLIDILLVLMMILMVITPITSQGLPAAVPESSQDPASQPTDPPIVVRIDRDSRILLNQELVPDTEFEERMNRLLARRSDAALFIDGDEELPFMAVARLVDRVRGLGFSRVAIMPREQQR
jgi:biopolymer transport protein ExbD